MTLYEAVAEGAQGGLDVDAGAAEAGLQPAVECGAERAEERELSPDFIASGIDEVRAVRADGDDVLRIGRVLNAVERVSRFPTGLSR